MEIKKNRKVKGNRALNFGLNPHSKGLIFSIMKIFFFLKNLPAIKTIIDKIKEIIKINIKYIIN